MSVACDYAMNMTITVTCNYALRVSLAVACDRPIIMTIICKHVFSWVHMMSWPYVQIPLIASKLCSLVLIMHDPLTF